MELNCMFLSQLKYLNCLKLNNHAKKWTCEYIPEIHISEKSKFLLVFTTLWKQTHIYTHRNTFTFLRCYTTMFCFLVNRVTKFILCVQVGFSG